MKVRLHHISQNIFSEAKPYLHHIELDEILAKLSNTQDKSQINHKIINLFAVILKWFTPNNKASPNTNPSKLTITHMT